MNWTLRNGQWTDGAGQPIKTVPIQTKAYGEGAVPWEVAAEGFKEYAAQYGISQSFERLCERGGFTASELAILLYERIKRLEGALTRHKPEPVKVADK